MIELTTGVVFLMSSLYGPGHEVNQNQAIVDQSPTQATTTVASSFTAANDPRIMEAYLRQEFIDAPILVEIARCESNFRHFDKEGNLVRGRVDSADVGVMQINERYWDKEAQNLGINIRTVEGNIAYAKHLYEKQGVSPWSASAKCWSAKTTGAVVMK